MTIQDSIDRRCEVLKELHAEDVDDRILTEIRCLKNQQRKQLGETQKGQQCQN